MYTLQKKYNKKITRIVYIPKPKSEYSPEKPAKRVSYHRGLQLNQNTLAIPAEIRRQNVRGRDLAWQEDWEERSCGKA
jgi:hypothetical protein